MGKVFMPAARKWDVTDGATGRLLGQSAEEVNSTTWLLGHDLKSPVAIIVSAMEVMVTLYEDDDRMAEIMPLVRGALAAANREHNMISDVLDLARFDLGEMQLNLNQHSLFQLIHDGLLLEDYNLRNKQLRLELDLPQDDPLQTEVDAELFLRVMSALVDNVLKFTIKDDRLLIRASRLDGSIVVEFADTGRPIIQGYEAAILQRAPQWNSRQAGSRTSVGMGLPFIRAVAESHGGDFRCFSDADAGLTWMKLRLPVK
jgi:two-component system, OmpR family, sensor histidine kinase KdpD